jgi:hypothetical protein
MAKTVKMGVHNFAILNLWCIPLFLVSVLSVKALMGTSSKNRPKTKVVELVNSYNVCLRPLCDQRLCYAVKLKIHFQTRRFFGNESRYR